MSHGTTIPHDQQDILDGYDYPTLEPNLQVDEGVPITQKEFEKKVSELSTETNPAALIAQLRALMNDQAEFNSVTGLKTKVPGGLAQGGKTLTDDEFAILIQSVRGKISAVRDKSGRIKDAIVQRQAANPTTVAFNPKTKPLLKRGMARVFKNKSNEITFDHYRAAIELRKLLSDETLDVTLKDTRRVLK